MTNKRRWIALLLTLNMGLGHFYIGEYRKALLLVFAPFVVWLIAWYLLQDSVSTTIGLIITLGVWLYAFVDIWRSFPIVEKDSLKYSRWYYMILYILFIGLLSFLWVSFSPIKTFSVPTDSMSSTLRIHDNVIANRGSEIKRNDVVVFRYPRKPETFFVKRLVAKGGDEVLYLEGLLLIHFSEGDEYIRTHYKEEHIEEYGDKLWVKNPYMIENKNINYHYDKERGSLFEILFQEYGHGAVAMTPIYLKNKKLKRYMVDKKLYNAFYIKVREGYYFMMGDNRESSNDSRFWGEVEKGYIFGIVKVVYFNYSDLTRIGTEIK